VNGCYWSVRNSPEIAHIDRESELGVYLSLVNVQCFIAATFLESGWIADLTVLFIAELQYLLGAVVDWLLSFRLLLVAYNKTPRTFYHAGRTVWNSLPDELRNSNSFDGLNDSWKQFFSAVTSVTSALEDF